jgi:hypothetical protein
MAPFISPFRTPVALPFRTPVISPPGIPIAHAHFAPRPIAVVVKPRTYGKTESKTYHRLNIRRIRLDVDNLRIILRHIDHIGFGGDHANVALLFDDPLLRSIDQGSRCSRLGAQRLNRIHDVSRLIQKDLSKLSRPFQILVHPLDDVGIAGQGPDALIPWLVINLSQIAVCGKKACRQDNIGRNCRCRQNYGNQSVRIKRNWSKQLVEFFLG